MKTAKSVKLSRLHQVCIKSSVLDYSDTAVVFSLQRNTTENTKMWPTTGDFTPIVLVYIYEPLPLLASYSLCLYRELSERGGVGTSARYLSLYTSCLVLAVVMLAVLGETTESPHLTLQQVSVIIPPRVRRCHAPSKRSYLVSCVHLQVFRHGDRNILSVYPFDPYHDNMTVWTEGIGQLTNRGKLQMWELGRYLRQHYGRLVPELYSPEDTLMTSSDVDRCLMSAQLVLAGLYPARGSQVWNPSLDWQPIPVHSTNPGQDKLIRMDAPCPAYSKEYELANNSSVIQNFTQEHADVFRIINEQGWPATRIDQINGVYDSLKIEESRGLILPDWATSIYPDKLREVLETYEAMRVHTPFMQKLISGPLLKAISGHMTSKMAGSLTPDRKLFLYSGHDSTITALLQGLGFPRKFVVEYGAALFFELYSTSDGLGTVKVLFLRNAEFRDPQPLKPDQTLEQFLSWLEPVIPTDWDRECQLNNTDITR